MDKSEIHVRATENTLVWTLQSPEGEVFDVSNVYLFVKQHPEWFPYADAAYNGIRYAGKWKFPELFASKKGRAATNYKGWTVLAIKRVEP